MDQIEYCQKRLDDVWKSSRWVTSIVSSCRAKKLSDIGVPLTFLNGDDRHFGSSPSISRVRFFRSETDTTGTLHILEDFEQNNAKRSQDETTNYANSDDIFSSSDDKCDPELLDQSDRAES
uniref:Uncharacterized protein n=1 Tax=Romanomermis culicivorax TaxID=13658 RepID=A0A915I653_ROMCU